MDITNEIIALACIYMGVNEHQLFSTNIENYVDARAIIYSVLYDLGMTDTETAHKFNVSRQAVNRLRNTFRSRMRKWSVRQAYSSILNQVKK